MIVLGVIADTHVPDRARALHPRILPAFREARVHAILHAGDVCTPSILEELSAVAPVYAVRGNRDWFRSKDLPMARQLTFEGITIGLTHGHGSLPSYLWDLLMSLLRGPLRFAHFEQKALRACPGAHAVVFGHSHAPINRRQDGVLLFNPGSPCCPNIFVPNLAPSVGLLRIDGQNVEGEIIFLPEEQTYHK